MSNKPAPRPSTTAEYLKTLLDKVFIEWEHYAKNAARDIDNLKAQVEQWQALAESRQREIDRLTDSLDEANRIMREMCRAEAAEKKGY